MLRKLCKLLDKLFGSGPEDIEILEPTPVDTLRYEPLIWSEKVTREFEMKVRNICLGLDIDPNWLMACMAFETGGTFDPSIKNMAGSGATGLIQFMPSTAKGLGTTVEQLAEMTAIEQLDYVESYFKPYAGRMASLGDVYMAILWPRGVGKPDEYVLWDKETRPTTYRQNAGLDLNKDGVITKAEAVARVMAYLK